MRVSTAQVSIDIGRASLVDVSGVQLRSLGNPEQKGGRWCRNSDETGVGDNRAGYASVDIHMTVRPVLHELRMQVWGESSRFSFVAHNGERYRTVDWGQPSGQAKWEEVRFMLRPWDLDLKGKVQRFGFGSRDRQVWVSQIAFKSLADPTQADRAALSRAREDRPGKLVLAASGASDFRIVLPKEADAVMRYAASELQRYLLDISGAYLPADGVTTDGPCLVLGTASDGRPKFTDPDGFAISTRPQRVEITGGNSLGMLFGVYAFLEQLGCRWIVPGPDGEVVPKHDPLIVPTLNVHEEPDFKLRWVGHGDWALKNRCNVNSTVAGERVGYVWKWSFHSFFGLLPPSKYWASHPEYYPLVGRVRRQPQNYSSTQVCTEHPEVNVQMACNIIDTLQKDPRIDVVALCPNDGGGFCTCPRCRALDPPQPDFWGRFSDRLAPFNNRVARLVGAKLPNKIIKTGAYAMYMRYPRLLGYVPEPNMAVQACHTYACNNHPIDSDCARNKPYFREPLERWAKEARHLWIYEYYIKGAWAGLLYTQTHVMRRDIPYYRRIGAKGFYTQWSSGTFHTIGLSYYVAARLIWDTEADVEALIRDYCDTFYAEAGQAMFSFFKTLERAFIDSEDCISPFGHKRVWIAAQQVFTPNSLDNLEAHLRRAEQLASAETIARRIQPMRVTFEYTKRTVNYLRAVTKSFDGIDSPSSTGFARAEANAREAGARLSAGVIEYLEQHGRGYYVKGKRSKIAALLSVHRNPRIVVPRWWNQPASSTGPRAPALPPIPGNRLVGRVAEHARVRLDRADEGVKGRWFAQDFDDSQWPLKSFPAYWQDAGLAKGGYSGHGWYRTHINMPPGPHAKDTKLMLRFEGVDAAADIYINGERAGKHKYVAGRSWQAPFEVEVTGKLKPSRNLLALRVYTGGGKGGVYGRVILYRLGDEPEDFMR